MVALAVGGCGGGSGRSAAGPRAPARSGFVLSSPAFVDGATLPARFTCSGAGVSPPLRWIGVLAGARSLVLLVTDPDAPGGTFTHWSVFGIPPRTAGLPEGIGNRRGAHLAQGRNSFGSLGYGAPCPPRGAAPHRYVFALYAVSRPVALAAGPPPGGVGAALAGALGRATLTARFGR